VFRRPAARPKLKCVTFDGVQKDETIADGRSVDGIRLFAHESVTLLGTGNAWLTVEWVPLGAATVPLPVRIVFDEPVVEVQVEFGDLPTGPHAVVLQAHDERGLVAESRSISPVRPGVYGIRVWAPAITHAFLVPAFGTLHGVCVTTHARECAEGWVTQVAELPLLPAPGSKAGPSSSWRGAWAWTSATATCGASTRPSSAISKRAQIARPGESGSS
jgi:hypothetical protein